MGNNNNNVIDNSQNANYNNNSGYDNSNPNTPYTEGNTNHGDITIQPRRNYLTYNNVIERLRNLNKMKHKLRKELGNIGIYLPEKADMKQILFCVYFYYMFNLFGDNNSNWKEKYFPLDGLTLYNFIETKMISDPITNKIYIDIANEIEAVTYPGRTEHSGNVVLNRGLIEEFIEYDKNNDTKSKIGEISNNIIDTDNVLTSTKGLLNKLLSIWKWKKYVIDSTRRKRKEDKQTPVIEENALLDDILSELQREPRYTLPKFKIDKIKLTNQNIVTSNIEVNSSYTSSDYPFTVYNNIGPGSVRYISNKVKGLFAPHNWLYDCELEIDNIRPNTKLTLYYKKNDRNYYQQPDPNSDFPSYRESNVFINNSWDKVSKTKLNLENITTGNIINVGYKDKYNGIYSKNNDSTMGYSYIGWKPEIFLYSKSVANKSISSGNISSSDNTRGIIDSPMDHMNLLDNEDFANLGLTILVPDVVEKFMKKIAPSINIGNEYGGGYSPEGEYFNASVEYDLINKIRGVETIFLVGIYPVDENNNVIYKDPIVFQFFSGEQLNDDLGLSFADYRKIKSATTKGNVLLRKYYNIKLGQMFYRNNYSRLSTEKKIINITSEYDSDIRKEVLKSISYENNKVGDVSKNLLYLYGRDNYMPYIGRTTLSPGQNHNITNPDDNTYIENITLPDNIEYAFKKYGNTKIAIQLYMNINNYNSDIYDLDYFKKIKEANGGFINDPRSNDSLGNNESLLNIPGSYIGLPYTSINESGTTINKAFPYGNDDIINTKIPYPNWTKTNGLNMSSTNPRMMSFITEPVIIDCNKSDEYNAPWLDKHNAPYVSKVVTEDFDYYNSKLSGNERYKLMKKGIYIKIPNDLNLYMLNDESVKQYELMKRRNNNEAQIRLNNKEFYGRVIRDKYIRAIKNALLGITVNYNPANNSTKSGDRKPEWFKTVVGSKKLFNDSKYFDIIEYNDELYIRLNGERFLDLEYAGLGEYGTIKIQLIFRNEFFRSDDINSPLNYKFVPTTGDVQLLREIAGQRIKLYRGGILAHPTDYDSKDERSIYRHRLSTTDLVTDISLTKEITYKHDYTKGFPTYAMDNSRLTAVEDDTSYISLSDNNSVYDIISIEMDYQHWLELQVDNIKRSPISSMETDTNDNSLPIPINIMDLENFDFLEYDIENKNSYLSDVVNSVADVNRIMSTKISLSQPNNDNSTYNYSNIDFYRMLNFWYIFRPKVKLSNGIVQSNSTVEIEPYDEWRTRILKENREFFNRTNIKISETDDRVVDLEDVFNIKCHNDTYSIYDIDSDYNKSSNSKNLYNIMKHIISNHFIYIEDNNSTHLKANYTFNDNNYKRAKFGGFLLDKLLYSDWVFTYRPGDNKKIDDIMRKSANDTALTLFGIFYYVNNDIKSKIIYSKANPSSSEKLVYVNSYVKSVFDDLLKSFMVFDNITYIDQKYNIYSEVADINSYLNYMSKPGEKRLINFTYNDNCRIESGYNKNNYVYDLDNPIYNVWDNRFYKGDNRKLDTRNTKSKLRRGFRMGDKTPDNPFMGFSMPATSEPELVPDHIHLIYCDIYWKDFDRTQSVINNPNTNIIFSTNPSKDSVLDTGNNLTYDFSGFIEKYKLREWKKRGKHVIFRLLIDEPTNERHKDCPEYISGSFYDNIYGKGFSPDFRTVAVQFRYKCAILALKRWVNEHSDLMNGLLYTIELPLGIQGNGNMFVGESVIPIMSINTIYKSVYDDFYGNNSKILGVNNVECKLIFSSSVDIPNVVTNRRYGWSFSNLGNRDYFEEWMKYNMYGADSRSLGRIAGGSYYGGNKNSHFNNTDNNKFKSLNHPHLGFSGVIRSDLNMDELMKPENFKELLYEMKTLTPMYVIGYVDKEKYPEQYETLMNEMGYKYTITSAAIEDGYLKVYYSNEGKNGIKSISDTTSLSINLKYKNKLKNTNINTSIYGINRSQSQNVLNSITSKNADISDTKINMGDVLMFRTTSPVNKNISRQYIPNKQISVNNSVENAYGKNMVDDVYLELHLQTEFNNQTLSIKLANINRGTDINLTDSGLLHIFISNYDGENGQLEKWFDTMYMNAIKVDDNGWI